MPTPLRTLGRRTFALLLASLTAALVIAPSTQPARADVPVPPAPAAFTAPRCDGTTTEDPANAWGAVPDLTRVFGQRLVDYNAGRLVLLYANDGTNGGVPNCGVRHVDGLGAVARWMYCTDHASSTCSVTNAAGRLEVTNRPLPGMNPLQGNARLTVEQERLVTYLISEDMPVTELVIPGWMTRPAGVANNATENGRAARQDLVWCVTDYSTLHASYRSWCDANMAGAEQQRVLALVPVEAELEIDADAAPVPVGTPAEVTVTTNLYNQPIDLDVDAGHATVCEGAATLVDGTLTVPGTDATTSTTSTLCVTATTAGPVSIDGSVAAVARDQVLWDQSPGASGIRCQVYGTLRSAAPVVASAAVTFRAMPAAPGGPGLGGSAGGTGTGGTGGAGGAGGTGGTGGTGVTGGAGGSVGAGGSNGALATTGDPATRAELGIAGARGAGLPVTGTPLVASGLAVAAALLGAGALALALRGRRRGHRA